MDITNLQSDMDYLFNCNFFDDSFDPEDHEDHQDFADKVLQSYSWDEIYGYFFRHLTQDCTTLTYTLSTALTKTQFLIPMSLSDMFCSESIWINTGMNMVILSTALQYLFLRAARK